MDGSTGQTVRFLYTGRELVRRGRFSLGKWVLINAACLLIVFSGSRSFAAYDDDRGFQAAADLLNQGSYLEALAAYNEIVTHSEIHDSRAKGLFFMGTIYSLYLDQYDEALRLYAVLMQDYSTSNFAQDALFNTGMVFYERGEFGQAYKSFKKYLEKYPTGKHSQSAEVWADSTGAEMGVEKPKELAPTPPHRLTVPETTLRVLIRDKVSKVTFDAAGVMTLSDPFSQQIIHKGHGPLTFTARRGRVLMNGRSLRFSSCTVATKRDILSLDGKPYRGSFRVLVKNNSKVQAINYIGLEKYLYGVVPREMSPGWKEDALKAQAVAARTYALYIKEKSKDKPYDLVATTASQVYGGYGAEDTATTRAVDATRGEVMTHEGRLVIAYFHANSGGFTESAKNVWVADLPYLRGIPDPYSENIPGGEWELSLSYDAIRDMLNQYGLKIGAISEISPVQISPSGRPVSMLVLSGRGKTVLKSNDFRLKIGAMKLKSTLFRLQQSRDGLQINGRGFGHGVGMSQWGAYRMAQAGYSYKDILKHYYKDVRVTGLVSR